jgi:large subunit ribosomal protein L34e
VQRVLTSTALERNRTPEATSPAQRPADETKLQRNHREQTNSNHAQRTQEIIPRSPQIRVIINWHFRLFNKYILTTLQWCRELPTVADSATTPSPTKSEKYAPPVRPRPIPGSKVVVQYVHKRGHGPRAPHDSCDCGKRINGIAQLRPYHYKKLAHKDKSISRPYGGVLCGGCVKSRIIRAFLLEEIKTIKRAKQVSKK